MGASCLDGEAAAVFSHIPAMHNTAMAHEALRYSARTEIVRAIFMLRLRATRNHTERPMESRPDTTASSYIPR